MEFWPRKKKEKKPETKLQLRSIFDPPGFAPHERAGYRSTFENVRTPEDFLNSVDFETLNGIFDDLERKSGLPETISNTGLSVARERISFRYPSPESEGKRSTLGTAVVATGEIRLFWHDEDVSPTVRSLQLLHVLSHEAAHVRGGYRSDRFEEGSIQDRNWVAGYKTRIGLEETVINTRGQDLCEGLGLNEAITEKIGLSVLTEYLKRTGHSGHPDSVEVSRMVDRGAYASERIVLEFMIEKIATASGLAVDTVWGGFVRAYMSGNQSLSELMKEIHTISTDNPKMRELFFEIRYGKLSDIPIQKILAAVHTNDRSAEFSSKLDLLLYELERLTEQQKFIDRALRVLELDELQNDLKLR